MSGQALLPFGWGGSFLFIGSARLAKLADSTLALSQVLHLISGKVSPF